MTWFRPYLLAVSLTATATLAAPALAQTQFSAELVGHALIPAATFLPPPPNAPAFFTTSGKFAGPDNTRNNTLYSIEGSSFLSAEEAPRMTGLFFPFTGQPLQGFSGIKSMGEGEYLVLVDNGFGSPLRLTWIL